MTSWWVALVVLIAGALVPIQTALNAGIGRVFVSPLLSTFVVFSIATVFLLLLTLLYRPGIPSREAIAQIPSVSWVGGVLGAFYILSLIYAAPKLGIGLTTALVILGQVAMGLAFDHFGLLQMPVQALSTTRVLGAAFVVFGVWLIKNY